MPSTMTAKRKSRMRVSPSKTVLAAAVVLMTASAASAGWQDQASNFDKQRLASLDEARLKGINEAKGGSGTGDASAIDAALGTQGHMPSPGEIAGGWQCRMIKLGGVTPYIVYGWFNCRISNRGGALFFEKLSGSQRTAGYLYPGEGGLVYLGASSVVGEPPHAYSGNGAAGG